MKARPTNGKSSGPEAPVRCAVYTRVSTDEQAALEYNSLQAQEEICKNYIAIRSADPGVLRRWVYTETYSDAGISGATLERPALKRLLADAAASRVDVIVAYKIDRISRSISQFYEMWRELEQHGVDFASATQEFNTATSQGRMMLNLLLTFGQYEREMIAERTKDKLWAARSRGLWTGGCVPLGYEIDREKRGLKVIPEEAKVVRLIFSLYIRTGSLGRVVQDLAAKGLSQKKRADAVAFPWTKNAVLAVLRNPLYVGKVRGRQGQLHDGQHEAIVDAATFETVGGLLDQHTTGTERQSRKGTYLLGGLLRCGACDAAMSGSFAKGRGGRTYRYYRCRKESNQAAPCPTGLLPIDRVEAAVVEQLRQVAKAGEVQARVLARLEVQRHEIIGAGASSCPAEKRLAALALEAKSLITACGQGKGRSKLLVGRLAEVEAEMDRLRGQLADLEVVQRAFVDQQATAARVADLLDAFDAVWDALVPDEKQELLRLVVQQVIVDPKEGRLRLTLHDLDDAAVSDMREAV